MNRHPSKPTDDRLADDRPILHWDRHVVVRLAVVGILWAGLFQRELTRCAVRWVTDPSWSHGVLIPLFSLYLLYQRRRDLRHCPLRPQAGALPGLVVVLLFYFFNVLSPSGYAYFRSLSAVGSLLMITWFWGGTALLRLTWLPIVYLGFAVPLPRRLYVALTLPLRRLAATVATALLDAVPAIEATVRGVVIDVIYRGQPVDPPLNVAEACSGMRLLMAFFALGVAMAALEARPPWQRALLVLASLPIAVFCNIVRVTLTGFLYVTVDPRWTQGPAHDLLGLAMLPLALGCTLFLCWVMDSLWIDTAPARGRDVVVPAGRSQESTR